MITRHIYESEEVEVALMYAIVRGRHVEAAFWCEELVCSKEVDRAWSVLYRTWLEQCLVVLPDWADTWLSTDTDIQEACAELCDVCRTRRDVSLPLVMLREVELRDKGVPEGIAADAAAAATDPLVDYFLRACKHGKGVAAWWAAQQLGDRLASLSVPSAGPRLFSYLETLDLPGDLGGWRAATMCAAVLLECLAGLGLKDGLCGKYTRGGHRAPMGELAEWRAVEGRRARRQFAIPRECLLCVTSRGRAPSKTASLPLLYTVHERILKGEGCHVWRRFTRHCAGGGSDEALEAFYSHGFPDDIPDEWSKEAQLQSHGPGSLASSEEPRWTKWARLWLEADSLFVWGASGSSLVSVLTPPTPDTLHWLECLYIKPTVQLKLEDPAIAALLVPMRKMMIVDC
jgi:hypothetical protein